MADEPHDNNSQPSRDDVPAPAQDGMVNTGQPVPKPATEPTIPQPPEEEVPIDQPIETDEGTNEAIDEAVPEVEDQAGSIDDSPELEEVVKETAGEDEPAPTVAELDKSHEEDLDGVLKEPQVSEKPAKPIDSKNKSTVLWVVIVAVLAALLLAGIGFAAWRASNSKQAEDNQTPQPSQEAFDESNADQLNQELENISTQLRQIETDLNATGLEDEDLGL